MKIPMNEHAEGTGGRRGEKMVEDIFGLKNVGAGGKREQIMSTADGIRTHLGLNGAGTW